MSVQDSRGKPRFIGFAYTKDVDPSVAGCSPMPGFGSFFIRCSGPITAVVGRNGSGKSRFLASLGESTELIFDMPEPVASKTFTVEHEDGTKEYSTPVGGLWGMVGRVDQADSYGWSPQDVAGWSEWVSALWQEAPRRRFEHLLSLISNDLLETLPGGPDVDPSPYAQLCADVPHFNDLLTRIHGSSEAERHLSAFAATAMHLFEYRAGDSPMGDLFAVALGTEIASFRRIGITGASTNGSQRLRFWFEADWNTSPACSALLASHARDGERPGRRKDLVDPPSDDEQWMIDLCDVLGLDASVVYAWSDVGLCVTTGTPMHFTPLLPLSLEGTAGVLHESAGSDVWLEGIRPRPSEYRQLSYMADVLNPLGDEGGACSWHLRRRTLRDLLEEPPVGESPSGSYEQFLQAELQDDHLAIEWVSDRWTSERQEEQARWLSSLVRMDTQPSPLDFRFSEDVTGFIQHAVRAVNAVARVISEDPPTAIFDLSSGEGSWRFAKGDRPLQSAREILELSQLSFAEQRWMRFSILIASRLLDRVLRSFGVDADEVWCAQMLSSNAWAGAVEHSEMVVVLDEPELGLHPTAVDRLARGLHALAEHLGVHFVVATHSPNVLGVVQSVAGTIAHAHAGPHGDTVVEALDPAKWDDFGQELGLNPVDLLQMTSTFLLVEGEHDRIVINNLIGDDIRRAGVVTTPLRGALKVSQIVDSDLVWRFTDARLVLVLDSIDADQMSGIVATAKQHVAEGDMRSAINSLDPLKRDRTSKGKTEREALYELLRAAVAAHRIDRLEIFGLREPDIIDYFHPRELGTVSPDSEYFSLGRREAWDVLHTRYMNTPKKERKDVGFKSWAVDVLGVGTDPSEVLRAASAKLDRIPDDFTRLRELLCSVKPSLE